METAQIWSLIVQAAAAMSGVEVAAVVFSVVYVVLAAKRNIWCWPAGFIASGLYVYLCLTADLLIESILQSYYVLMAVYGWFVWSQHQQNQATPILTLSLKKHLQFIALGIVTAAVAGYVFTNFTNAAIPYLDAFTTVFSFMATWMVAKKVLENWIYWIVIDFASIFLYGSREYYLTSLLYLAYTLIAVLGYLAWKKSYQTQLSASPS